MYGDLLLTPEQEKLLMIDVGDGGEAQGFLNRGVRFWPNGIVPYELDSSLSECTIIILESNISMDKNFTKPSYLSIVKMNDKD